MSSAGNRVAQDGLLTTGTFGAVCHAVADFTGYFHELVVEAQRSNTLIADDARDVGPLLWVLLHGLAMSNHLVANHTCESRTGYEAEDLPRVLALALRNLAPR